MLGVLAARTEGGDGSVQKAIEIFILEENYDAMIVAVKLTNVICLS